MDAGNFYYLIDEYYEKFEGCNLIGNKETDENGKHGRPCYYCFKQNGYYWMIPISSKVIKYKKLYEQKMARYQGNFDGIRFGYVNGQERAFLIQNMCPVTDKYIGEEYCIEKGTRSVVIADSVRKELNGIARKVIRLYMDRGIKIVLTDFDTILKGLSE